MYPLGRVSSKFSQNCVCTDGQNREKKMQQRETILLGSLSEHFVLVDEQMYM